MIEIFKEWTGSIVSIAILAILIKLIVPNSNMKKYVYSLLGLVTILVIFKPILYSSNIENVILDVTKNIQNNSEKYNYTDFSNYEEINSNNVKEEFKKKIEEDIVKIIKENIEENSNISVKVEITKEYNISSVIIAYSGQKKEEIKNIISSSYDIPKESIVIN